MRTIAVVGALAVGLAGAVGPGDHVAAVARMQDWDSGKVVERRYVDGVAIRATEGTVALLTPAPVDDCQRLAVVMKNSIHVDSFASEEQPVLAIVRSDEYPEGSVQLIEPYSTTYLAETVPGLEDAGDRMVAKGQTDPGSLSSDSDEPSLEYDVDLGFVSRDDYDPLVADSGAEAAWLRKLAAVPEADREAVVEASFLLDEDDYDSTSSRYTWAEILGDWEGVSVIAAASGPECATLVLRAPAFAGGARRAIVKAVGAGDARKVVAVETEDEYPEDGGYVVGRVEHPAFGAFPILYARAMASDSGPVVLFSDRPLGEAPWEELVARQRVLRTVVTQTYGDSFNFGSYEVAGPGAEPATLEAATLTNAYLDADNISALIKQGEAGGARVVINFQLPLSGVPVGP